VTDRLQKALGRWKSAKKLKEDCDADQKQVMKRHLAAFVEFQTAERELLEAMREAT
jgi:hypothetical protein